MDEPIFQAAFRLGLKFKIRVSSSLHTMRLALNEEIVEEKIVKHLMTSPQSRLSKVLIAAPT
jgi:hypothetical protein